MRRLAALALGISVAVALVYAGEMQQRKRETGSFMRIPDLRYALLEPEMGRRGYSDKLTPQPKGGDVRNFLAVGDSVTFGVGVGPLDAWPGALRERLGARHTQVYNFGVAGWDAEQVATFLETRAMAWVPDGILWGAYANDLFPTEVIHASSSGTSIFVGNVVPEGARVLPRGWGEWLLPRSALFRHFQAGAYERALASMKVPPRDPERFGAAVDRIMAWSESTGVPVLVIAIPPHATYGTCDVEPCLSMKEWYPEMTALLRARGVLYVDIDPVWQGRAPFWCLSMGADPDHPNADGHRLIVDTIAPIVDALVAVPTNDRPRHRRPRR